jgi:hypothetical protein
VSESEQRVLWRLLRRGLGSGEKGAENSPPRPPFSATFSQAGMRIHEVCRCLLGASWILKPFVVVVARAFSVGFLYMKESFDKGLEIAFRNYLAPLQQIVAWTVILAPCEGTGTPMSTSRKFAVPRYVSFFSTSRAQASHYSQFSCGNAT